MSSFKRKTAKSAAPLHPSTRLLASTSSTPTILTSTGISSLDDILGGGLPLTCSLVIAAPDVHSAYGELVAKYFAAEGIAGGQKVIVVGERPKEWLKQVMWLPKADRWGTGIAGGGQPGATGNNNKVDSDDEDKKTDQDGQVKIAWRYQNMGQFQTTVGVGGDKTDGTESYCHAFELTNRIPDEVVEEGIGSGQIEFVDVERHEKPLRDTIDEIKKYAGEGKKGPVRVCIVGLGSPAWGEVTREEVVYFLQMIRRLLREQGDMCSMTVLGPELCLDNWEVREGWVSMVGWSCDGMMSMNAFGGNVGLSTSFPGHHGTVSIQTLPSPYTQTPPSDRFSTLRGSSTGSGENNLAFKCTRRRLVFETLHLDIEGGTSERRVNINSNVNGNGNSKKSNSKNKKSVGFISDRPDVYDF